MDENEKIKKMAKILYKVIINTNDTAMFNSMMAHDIEFLENIVYGND